MRHRFDDIGVAADGIVEHVGRIAGGAETQNIQPALPVGGEGPDRRHDFLGVGHRVASGNEILLGQDLAVLADQHGLGTGRTAVETDIAADMRTGRQVGRREFRHAIARLEVIEIVVLADERQARRRPELRLAPVGDEIPEIVQPRIGALVPGLFHPEHRRPARGIILRVVRRENQLIGIDVGRLITPIRPGLGYATAPAFLQEGQEAVGAAQQQHFVAKGVAAGQYREVLHHDRIDQRVHELVGRNAGLDQVHDVGFGEHPAFRGNIVQLAGIESQRCQCVARHAQLDQAFVDGRPRPRGAFVVHRGDDLAPAGFRVFLENNDLGVLAAEFDNAVYVGVQPLDGDGHRIDFLNEARAQLRSNRCGAGTSDESPDIGMFAAGEGPLDIRQHFGHDFRLVRLVSLVAAPEKVECRRFDDHAFDCRGPHINADIQFPLQGFRSLTARRAVDMPVLFCIVRYSTSPVQVNSKGAWNSHYRANDTVIPRLV